MENGTNTETERERVINTLLSAARPTFTFTAQEEKILRDRISKYDCTELKNFVKNYRTIGINKIVECIYDVYLDG